MLPTSSAHSEEDHFHGLYETSWVNPPFQRATSQLASVGFKRLSFID